MSSFGWIAAFVSCLAFGSFAVPIKGEAANSVNIDPLVMQSYKTGMCFLTCWSVVLLGEKVIFTPWGLVSGLFWVPGGTAGIYAVRTSGLAVSQGIWSTLKIMVAFVWGIFVFREKVRKRWFATVAVLLMIIGLWGMSYFSSPAQVDSSSDDSVAEHRSDSSPSRELEKPLISSDDAVVASEVAVEECSDAEISLEESEAEYQIVRGAAAAHVHRVGLVCAAVDGIWGGSILVPMHYAKRDAEGLGYIISFAVGASTVLILMWFVRFSYHVLNTKSLSSSVAALPSFHLRIMWLPGATAGLLWSIGNFCSILAVQNLGEGVGYSIVQSQLLVAGLWGIFYFREVQGFNRIIKWLACGSLTVAGILLLSHEHLRTNQ